ncbi:MAG: DUF3187 family protein [Gammaproteobacteria bacterium]|nr:DUF3187 family protein [Gammaproteobacteria bacterium]MBL6998494.1 DUF3187 family protein [Gammaproteobacteria bacterium]
MDLPTTLKKSIPLLLPLLLMTNVRAGQFVLDVAYQLESGDYGSDTSTDVSSIPLQLKYFADVWSFALEVPYVSVRGDATVVPGVRGQSAGQGPGSSINTPTSTTQSVTRSGIGDSQLSVSRAFFPQQQEGIFYELTATVKLATADQKKSLGTGETDYSIKLSMSMEMGNWMPGVSAGYQLTGDTADTDFNDVWFFSAGTGYRLDQSSRLSAGIDFEQAVNDGADDFTAVSLGYSRDLASQASVGINVKAGLTDNSLDKGLSVFVSIPFK